MKKYFNSFTNGITIGLFSSIIFSFINGGNYYATSPITIMGKLYYDNFNETQVLLISTILWGIIGILSYYLGSIYKNISQVNLFKHIIKYYFIHLLMLIVFALLLGWIDVNVMHLISFSLIFTFIYIIIFIAIYNQVKKEINDINSSLKK